MRPIVWGWQMMHLQKKRRWHPVVESSERSNEHFHAPGPRGELGLQRAKFPQSADICTWTSPRRDARSGRVCDTAYCRLPINPLSLLTSDSEAGLSGSWRLDLPMSIGRMLRMYSRCEARMEWSGSCSIWVPVKTISFSLKEPKGRAFRRSSSLLRKYESPPPIPSSTRVPRVPCKTRLLLWAVSN